MRLHDLLEAYLAALENALAGLPAYAESYVEEILTAQRLNPSPYTQVPKLM